MMRAAYIAGLLVGCLASSVVGALAVLSWVSEHQPLADDGDPEFGEPFVSWGQDDE